MSSNFFLRLKYLLLRDSLWRLQKISASRSTEKIHSDLLNRLRDAYNLIGEPGIA
ncbi:hypothetical protein DSO57_1014416 [Entomophthora muscae]|uniref:Uncharacterized protein n=1 Tax=Entomophthora muscae TaxID=34485 RepID=A0ACC2UF36_9FUNG|nr:hypothetical protein DSO57_1014416 [Entomophthora muscae]